MASDQEVSLTDSLSSSLMESYAMADKLLVNLWGASISADGVWAIAAAVVIVLMIAWRKAR
jgi:hypothetical protein